MTRAAPSDQPGTGHPTTDHPTTGNPTTGHPTADHPTTGHPTTGHPTTDWPDPNLYPFAPHHLELPGGRMHYLDEGAGEPILFVHGTPTWSFLWRHLVSELRGEYRCVAPDHLGFGLSDKPPDADYTTRAHAENLERLVDGLGLRDLTLVVHDYGGPIGLAYALKRPENVRRVVVMNSWLWSNEGDRAFESAARLLGGPVGRFLYTALNFSPRVILPAAYGDKRKLTPEVHRHYLAPFAKPAERLAPWVLARELTAANARLDSLWQQRAALAGKPMLLLWGLADKFITAERLRRWREAFPAATVEALEGVGHFVPEEAPERVTAAIREFLREPRP